MVKKSVVFLVMMAFALVNAHAANYLLKYHAPSQYLYK